MNIISKFTASLFSSFQSQTWPVIYSSVQPQKFPVLSNKHMAAYLSAPRIWISTVRGWSLKAVTHHRNTVDNSVPTATDQKEKKNLFLRQTPRRHLWNLIIEERALRKCAGCKYLREWWQAQRKGVQVCTASCVRNAYNKHARKHPSRSKGSRVQRPSAWTQKQQVLSAVEGIKHLKLFFFLLVCTACVWNTLQPLRRRTNVSLWSLTRFRSSLAASRCCNVRLSVETSRPTETTVDTFIRNQSAVYFLG